MLKLHRLTILFFAVVHFNALGQPVINEVQGAGYDFKGNGKQEFATKITEVYNQDLIPDSIHINETDVLRDAVKAHILWLNKNPAKSYRQHGITTSNSEMSEVCNYILQCKGNVLDSLRNHCKFLLLQGEDSKGNTQFTSYYLPVLDVSDKRDSVFRYPIYRYDASAKNFSRKEIDERGALMNRKLELAWASDYFELHSMMVQGSGYGRYPDGKLVLFQYAGKNSHPYVSIGRYLSDRGYISPEALSLESVRSWFYQNPDSLFTVLSRNPSYVFFRQSAHQPVGAAGIPLVADVSVAADLSVLPKGSILLAEVPVLDENNLCISHSYRIFLVHDTGGAIRGPGHIDIFAGTGKEAEKKAGAMHHYGRLWLILPKE
jgi:membrane-bound lytic murein transglycosylase A